MLYSFIKTGELKRREGGSITEGTLIVTGATARKRGVFVLSRGTSSRRPPPFNSVLLTIRSGIGQGRVTDNLKGALIDDAVFIPDEQSIEMAFRMLHEEGICLGASSALNAAAAFEVGGRGRGRKGRMKFHVAQFLFILFSNSDRQKSRTGPHCCHHVV